jgi:hypothetical protein
MGQKVERADSDDMRPEYDFSGAVRGKYYERYRAGTNVVLLDADVAQVFPTSQNVNDALRVLIRAAQGKLVRRIGRARQHKSLTQRSTRPRPRGHSGTGKRVSGRGG